nr:MULTISPECIES: DNA damage-inducible protein D [unclassified Clostridium]
MDDFFFFDTEQIENAESSFDSIRHVNEYGQEFWYARELMLALNYKRWDKFFNVIEKAKVACANSSNNVSDHFSHVGKIVNAGATCKDIGDIQLSRYACYLIVQNGDPRKEVIALGQTYFAIKTRQQELFESQGNLDSDQLRIAIRREMALHNRSLSAAAHDAGVETSKDFAIFHNKGYQGLYGGLSRSDIHSRKKLKKSQQILDYMSAEELAANLFRTTQAEAKLVRDHVQGKENANQLHYDVGREVRETIARLGGTMPENLPVPQKSIQQLERKERKRLK